MPEGLRRRPMKEMRHAPADQMRFIYAVEFLIRGNAPLETWSISPKGDDIYESTSTVNWNTLM